MKRLGVWLPTGCVALFAGWLQAAPQSAPVSSSVSQRAFLNKDCVAYHSNKLKTGGLTLETIDVNDTPAGAETWERVIPKQRGGAMPSQGMPHADQSTLNGFVSSIEGPIDCAAAALAVGDPGIIADTATCRAKPDSSQDGHMDGLPLGTCGGLEV